MQMNRGSGREARAGEQPAIEKSNEIHARSLALVLLSFALSPSFISLMAEQAGCFRQMREPCLEGKFATVHFP